MSRNVPPQVEETFKGLKERKDGYLQLRNIGGGWYVQQATSVWDREEKKTKKITTHLGSITEGGKFIPKTPRGKIPFTEREIFEYANGRLAYHLLKDAHQMLDRYTPYADELIAMAVIRAIDPQPLRLHPSRWQKLYLSQELPVTVTPKHLSKVLKETGQGKGWWYDFFTELIDTSDFLLYDLTSVFSRSQNIKRAEKGYNPDKIFMDQVGVILAFSTATGLPAGVEVFWGSMKDITTFKDFLDILEPREVGFIVDRGLVSEELVKDFQGEGINYVFPLRKDSKLIDLRWLRWQDPFIHRERAVRWARRHTDVGTLYLFEDPELRGEQQKALMRRLATDEIGKEKYEKKQEMAGIIAILSDLDRSGPEIYDLCKCRHDVELAFDAMKNHLDADKTYMQSDEAVRGYFFVTFLALRVYFGVLTRLRELDKTSKISVKEVFYELSKVERTIGPSGKESYAKITKQARKIVELFPEALPMV